MFRKIVIIVICVFLLTSLAGCETIQRKFTRKPKEPVKPVPKFYEEEYKSEYPNSTLYDNHYMYWKAWMDELITALEGDNNKKQKQTVEYALGEIKSMQRYLMDVKAQELQKDIDDLDKIAKKINLGTLTSGMAISLRVDADRHLMRVKKDFSLSQVKDYIKPQQ